jgi:hypothetical protein
MVRLLGSFESSGWLCPLGLFCFFSRITSSLVSKLLCPIHKLKEYDGRDWLETVDIKKILFLIDPESMAAPNPKCAVCGKTAYPLETIKYQDNAYHKLCFKCRLDDGRNGGLSVIRPGGWMRLCSHSEGVQWSGRQGLLQQAQACGQADCHHSRWKHDPFECEE